MFQTIFSATAVFISTSIDYLVLLLIVFSQTQSKSHTRQIYAGHYLGTAFIVGASLIAAYILNFIPEQWMIGLLGIIPIGIGLYVAFSKEDDEEEEEVEKILSTSNKNFFWAITLLTIASGGDNLGVYIPYFISLSLNEILIVLLIFVIGIAALCYVSKRFATLPFLSNFLERFERIIVPIVLIALGIYILWENQTVQTFIEFI